LRRPRNVAVLETRVTFEGCLVGNGSPEAQASGYQDKALRAQCREPTSSRLCST